jgi:hypothetical protein
VYRSEDPDLTFYVNVDPDPDPVRIQDFDDQKMKEKFSVEKI